MSNIEKLFAEKNKKVLNVYCTAGFPERNSTLPVIRALQQYGADLIEIGMPYSDPLADGPVIQASSTRALANGMTIPVLFAQLKELRKEINLPVLLMGYMNPVLQYGFERFCADAKSVGIDGLILPDLPMQEFEEEYGPIIKKNELDFIFLVTPETTEQRIRKLDALSSGFLYAVSSSSTTGKGTNIAEQSGYFKKLSALKLRNPILVGFGIRDKQTFDEACVYTNGAIIGTAYIKALETAKDIDQTTKVFLDGIIG
jgi:tryptophan synthase alpha chain